MRRISRWLAATAVLCGAAAAAQDNLAFTADRGTWMQADPSPDGREIVFDLLGDIYAVPAGGGAARAILTGTAHETHPAIAPDGRHIAFVSDRDGALGLWIARRDGRDPRRIDTDDAPAVLAQPAWSADGSRVIVSRLVYPLLGFELWSYPVAGGAGARLTAAQPNGDDDWDERKTALGVFAARDGTLVYATKRGDTFVAKPPSAWSIVRRTPDGAERTIVSRPGGAFAPALSADGALLAYATRGAHGTELRLRTLATGADRALGPLDPDGMDGGYYGGVLPRFRFLAGDRALLVSRGGRFERVPIDGSRPRPIRFDAPVSLPVHRAPRPAVPVETGPVRARIAQAPRLSPDGRTIAFSAFGRLHRAGPDGPARALTAAGDDAFMPAWSPDGARLAYVRWTARDAGAVWVSRADGTAPRRLTTTRAFYTEPAFSPDGRTIAALRASHDDRVAAETEIGAAHATTLVLIDLATGRERALAGNGVPGHGALAGARSLRWSADGGALHLYGADGLQRVTVADGAVTTLARFTGTAASRYVGAPAAADDAVAAPDGRAALVRHGSQLWRVALPPTSGATVDLAALPPSSRLTMAGADGADWLADGGVAWWLGAAWYSLPPRSAAGIEATRRDLVAEHPRAVPVGSVVLRGATVLTMQDDPVVADGDVVVTGDRIVAVGPRGTVPVPAGVRVVDVAGKTIMPGLIDAHAHWWNIRRGVLARDDWNLALNLAFGVTAGLDVQSFTPDVFAYGDLVAAGRMAGPRIFSTGPGYFANSPHATDAEVDAVLGRYRDGYRTPNVKAYMVGDRAVRARIAARARRMGMIATTEGASDLPLGLTHAVDGFAGQEHTLAVSPLHDDVVRLMAFTRIGYTPTFGSLYGGASATDAFGIAERWQDDPRIRCLMPPALVAAKHRGFRWVPERDRAYPRFAADALRIQRAGGLVALGSHGEVQGLGMHWEMAAYVAGGATPLEAIAAATRGSAEAIGRHADLGSIAAGKLADLVILDADPRQDIRHTRRIADVMQNGRIVRPTAACD